jgi:hypothetical protein
VDPHGEESGPPGAAGVDVTATAGAADVTVGMAR